MRIDRVLAAVCAAAAALAFAGSQYLALTYSPGFTVVSMYRDATLVPKILLTFASLALPIVVVLAFVKESGFALRLVSLCVAAATVGAAGYSLITAVLLARDIDAPMQIAGPAYAEALFTLAFGMAVAAGAALAASFRAARL